MGFAAFVSFLRAQDPVRSIRCVVCSAGGGSSVRGVATRRDMLIASRGGFCLRRPVRKKISEEKEDVAGGVQTRVIGRSREVQLGSLVVSAGPFVNDGRTSRHFWYYSCTWNYRFLPQAFRCVDTPTLLLQRQASCRVGIYTLGNGLDVHSLHLHSDFAISKNRSRRVMGAVYVSLRFRGGGRCWEGVSGFE